MYGNIIYFTKLHICRKAKAWLQEHDIPYTERNIFSEHLTIDEIKQILK